MSSRIVSEDFFLVKTFCSAMASMIWDLVRDIVVPQGIWVLPLRDLNLFFKEKSICQENNRLCNPANNQLLIFTILAMIIITGDLIIQNP